MIELDILLELSDLLTELSYFTIKKDEYFDFYTSLKNLYDSIGFYKYNDSDPLDILNNSLIATQGLNKIISVDDDRLINRVSKVINKIQHSLGKVQQSIKDTVVSDRFISDITERNQVGRDVKKLMWRFGYCLAICLREGITKENRLLKASLELFDFLNKAIYTSQDLSIIKEELPYFKSLVRSEVRFREARPHLEMYRDNDIESSLDTIQKEYKLTVRELKKLFKPLKEVIINDYITLKFEKGRTNIYIQGELINQCKSLLFTLPVNQLEDFEEINSIDEIADMLKWTLNGQQNEDGELLSYDIPPEVEFWGHRSNLQVWIEHDYDTRILHSSLSFPLLKKLTEVGDHAAKKVFQEEIYQRFESFYPNTVRFLLAEGYLQFLTQDQRETLLLEWLNKDPENVFMFLIGNKYLDIFGEQYRSIIVKKLSNQSG